MRIPASLCGITGLKTTVGQVSRAGVFPLSHTLDSVGPLTRTAEDAALVYTAIRGRDPHDPSTLANQPTSQPTNDQDVLAGLADGVRGLRLAFAESAFWDDANPEVVAAVRGCGPVFADLGAHARQHRISRSGRDGAAQPARGDRQRRGLRGAP